MSNVQKQAPADATYSNATSVTKTFASACTNPSLIIAAFTSEIHNDTPTISDNGNAGNYSNDKVASSASISTGGGTSCVASIQNTKTTALTITATPSASSDGTLQIFEYTGPPTSSALDSTASYVDDTAATMSVTFSTLSNNCTVISAWCGFTTNGSGGPSAADTNYTQSFAPVLGFNSASWGEWRTDAGASGSITLTGGTSTGNPAQQFAIAAYKTGGGDTLVPQIWM